MAALSTGGFDRAGGSTGVPLRLHQPANPAARIEETSQNLGAGAERAEVSVYYHNIRTSFHFGKMQDAPPGQYQDSFHGALQHPRPTTSGSQPVQNRTQPTLPSIIPVPKHRLDEAIAAAALTSLSSGPMVLAAGAGCHSQQCTENAINSSSSSSSNSCELYMSIPSTPSPPLQAAPSLPCADAGLEDSDTTHFLFGEPVPRKRKNSGRLMFRCLWKNCEKVLSTSAAIQKHIRTEHLGPRAGPQHNDGEEDFYYTEMDVNVDTLTDGLSSLTPTSPTTTGPPPPFLYAGSLGAANNMELPLVSPLSLSAPSTLCHVHSDHAYQAPSPVSVSFTPKVNFSWQSPPPLLIRASPVPPTLNISEKRPQVLTAPPNIKQVPGTRKPRGEAKKCRKVYGMERKDMWCTACRWKKACQRFID
ncbi:SLC2A4 regulator isoform 1-T1 [Anomaloglossus baeobatrachus]|uniref:SLC2A4 regulator isoform X1 n=2 Tax=Anomaloglossus baeobatrachus TaxID=238106 RepID=UPI003F502BB7